MRNFLVLVGLLLAAAGTASGQEFPKVETSPAFMFIHNSPVFGGSQSFNCAGGGGTLAYNISSMFGIAADLGGCKAFGLANTYGIGNRVTGSEFTYLFGPRITFRSSSPFQPFLEVSVGGMRVAITCINGNLGNACNGLVPSQLATLPIVFNPTATTFSKNAFALAAGGGFDIKLNNKIAIRLVQVEYLYSRFGNQCAFPICSLNNNQNSFRLKSGIVIGWGGSASSKK
jgi:opacity protein-like surface antigen